MKSQNHATHKAMTLSLVCTALLCSGGIAQAIPSNSALNAVEQTKTVTGQVVDNFGEPILGATIQVVGTTKGCTTDLDGNFSLTNLPTDAVLKISFVGYQTIEVPTSGKSNLSITLSEDNEQLDEVVVVGYGTMKKSDLTGAVGSVSAKKLAQRGTTSVANALQGSVPGVSITQSNSRAGGGFDIQIRGQASINKQAQPLFVIDGVVCESMDFLNPEDIERVDILKDASSTAIYGSRASAGVVMITTKGSKGSDKGLVSVSYDGYYGVKKMTRLPDFMTASEFMDYRFAHFTLLDNNTYEGSSRKGVDATGHPHYTISDANAQTAFLMRSNGTSYRDSKLYDMVLAGNEGYDWSDYVTRDAQQQNHFVSLNGASEKVNYRLGIGYQNDESVFKNNDYSRFNVKGAFDGKINNIFEAGMSVNMAHSVTEDFCTDTSYSPYQKAFMMNAFVNPYNAEGALWANPGSKAAFDSNSQFTSTINPLIDLYNKNDQDQKRNFYIMGNVYLRANILDGLRFTTTFSPNFHHTRRGVFYAKGVSEEYPQGSSYYTSNGTSYASVTTTDRFDWTWDNQIEYNKKFGKHTVGAMALFSLYQSNTEIYSASGKDISDDLLGFYALDKAAGDKTISSAYTENQLVSTAFRVNYSYNGRYMATFTARADGSSRFAKGNRWGWFPSAALAWRISDETFMEPTRGWLSNLKLRASYGVTGNNNVDDYVTNATAAGPYYITINGTDSQGYFTNGLINQNLLWEKVKELDFGLDVSVLHDRISLTADWYNRLSDGQIMDRIVPVETGESSSTFNVGSVQNRGIELGLQVNVVRTKHFSWDISANYSRNWNKILELSNGKTDEVASNRFIGEPLNSLRDYTHTAVITDKGVTMHTQDGDIHYTLQELYDKYGKNYKWYEGQIAVNDWNNDGKIDDSDKQIYGCTDPKWIGSLTSTMAFYGFDFTVSAYTKQGQWSRSYFHDQYARASDRGTQHIYMDFYIPQGAPYFDHKTGNIEYATEIHYGKYPYFGHSDTSYGGYYSDKGSAKGENYQYQQTSFVKIKNITLGYTLPKKVLPKIHMQNVRLYCNITDPFCFTDYEGFDPEWANSTLTNGGPASLTCQFGANIKF